MEGGVFIVAIVLGLIPAYIASQKGHDFWPWWIYGALLFIVALPHAILTGSGAKVDAKTVQQLLDRIETRPGQTQGELGTRAGLEMPQVIGGLLELKNRGMIRFERTGDSIKVRRELVPEVRVYPR